MSSFIATISKIQRCDNLHIVNFNYNEQTLSMMSLDLNENIKEGSKVKLLTKPTLVAIAKDIRGELSYSNQLPCTISSIENGELLTGIKLDYQNTIIESIITQASSKRMNLKVGDSVVALIKASELSIGEVL